MSQDPHLLGSSSCPSCWDMSPCIVSSPLLSTWISDPPTLVAQLNSMTLNKVVWPLFVNGLRAKILMHSDGLKHKIPINSCGLSITMHKKERGITLNHSDQFHTNQNNQYSNKHFLLNSFITPERCNSLLTQASILFSPAFFFSIFYSWCFLSCSHLLEYYMKANHEKERCPSFCPSYEHATHYMMPMSLLAISHPYFTS